MNAIFHDWIGHSMEIDYVVVKSKVKSQHLVDLEQALIRMKNHNSKMNPAKCALIRSSSQSARYTDVGS